MKLYATITNANGKTVKIGDNEDIVINLYKGNNVIYVVRLSYCNVGDIEDPTMDTVITCRDYRKEKVKKKKGEICDNTDHRGKHNKIKKVILTEDFNNDTASWCENCRNRDADMVQYL